jgi:hypothetical protein
MKFARVASLVLVVGSLALVTACAAKGPLAKAQVAALTAGQSAHEIRTIEASLYAQGRYDKAKHDELLEKGVLPIIDGALGYERAVAACSAAPCSNVDQAQKALVSALDELDKITPGRRCRANPTGCGDRRRCGCCSRRPPRRGTCRADAVAGDSDRWRDGAAGDCARWSPGRIAHSGGARQRGRDAGAARGDGCDARQRPRGSRSGTRARQGKPYVVADSLRFLDRWVPSFYP